MQVQSFDNRFPSSFLRRFLLAAPSCDKKNIIGVHFLCF
jgi:hypothetical protein